MKRRTTGEKDIKGKEIFEDDLVMVNHPQDMSGDFTNSLQRVFYWDGEGRFYHGNGERPPKRMWGYCEVVGNTHDNPEMYKPR